MFELVAVDRSLRVIELTLQIDASEKFDCGVEKMWNVARVLVKCRT
jgi:hypothetical protein